MGEHYCIYCLACLEDVGRAVCSWSDHCESLTCSEACPDCGRTGADDMRDQRNFDASRDES